MSSKLLERRKLKVFAKMDLSLCNGCDECGLRCEAGVPMSREEYDAVREFVDAADNRAEIGRVLKQVKTVDMGDDVKVQMCRYRDMERGRCMVYSARPLICRMLGHFEFMPCPIEKFKPTVPTEEALKMFHEYAKEPRRTFEQWDDTVSGGANGA